jgi:uncharacterized cupredoxin-like copper-binding protein
MRGSVKVALLGAAVAVVLAGGSTVALAAASGALTSGHRDPDQRNGTGPNDLCSAPALPGAIIDVTLADTAGRMQYGRPGGMMGPGYGPMMAAGRGMPALMVVRISPTSGAAGTVSLRVTNAGALWHELVVLPLALDGRPGQRAVGVDGTVDETGSLAEASNTCGSDGGDGIVPGGKSWTTVQLAPGRYELLCNLPGPYAAGMYAELDVTTA